MSKNIAAEFNRIVRVLNKHGLKAAEQLFINIIRHPNCKLTDEDILLLRNGLREAVLEAMPKGVNTDEELKEKVNGSPST